MVRVHPRNLSWSKRKETGVAFRCIGIILTLGIVRWNILNAPDLSIYDVDNKDDGKIENAPLVTPATDRSGNFSNQPVITYLYGKKAKVSDDVFADLMIEAGGFASSEKRHMMEVGMHRAKQCISAAESGLISHCIEPSPKSRGRIEEGFNNALTKTRRNVRFYQLAGSGTSGVDLSFSSSGSTGDHVGDGGIDVWTMSKSETTSMEKEENVVVKSVAIDDILNNKIEPTIDYEMKETGKSERKIESLYMLKIDVQGHEPLVFEGVQESIRKNKIDMILFEYWPKGIDFLNGNLGTERECQVPVRMMHQIVDAGYKMYALAAMSHPAAPLDTARKEINKYNRGGKSDHLNSLEDHCKWLYKLDSLRDGKMKDGLVYEYGFWTDILAVRSGFRFPTPPTTSLGKFLMGEEHV